MEKKGSLRRSQVFFLFFVCKFRNIYSFFQAIANRLSLRSPGSTLFPFAKTLNKTIERGGNSTFPKFVFFSQKLLKGRHKTAKDITLKAVCVENVLPVSFYFNKNKSGPSNSADF